MKKYSTVYSNGYAQETSSPHEAINWVCYDDQQTFALAGKPVTSEEFFAAVRAAVQQAWDKKSETHKRVRVLHGSSVASYVEVWTRR